MVRHCHCLVVPIWTLKLYQCEIPLLCKATCAHQPLALCTMVPSILCKCPLKFHPLCVCLGTIQQVQFYSIYYLVKHANEIIS